MTSRQAPASPETIDLLRKYHRLVLAFSKNALGTLPIPALLHQACECASEGMSVKRAKVLQHRPHTADLLIVAGVGWGPGVVGQASLPGNRRSPPGLCVLANEPTFIDNLPEDPAFDTSPLLREHGIISLVNVPIAVDDGVWGVLEVDSTEPRQFDADHREFLRGFAAIIGRTIENRRQLARAEEAGLGERIRLQERETLFRELQHRIGNQLQLIIGSLEVASQRMADPDARAAFETVAQRAVSIARSHEQLSLSRVENEVSLAAYLNRLIPSLGVPDIVAVTSSLDDATVALGTAVRLGLIVNEVVINSVKHAFGADGGHIAIRLAIESDGTAATLCVTDDGKGMDGVPAGGSGISLIRTLAQQIGGNPDWSPAPERGTAFRLSFRP